MVSKSQVAASMARECDLCIHLFSKLTPEGYSYQPSPKQRTSEELLQYLSICGIAGIKSLLAGSFAPFGEYREQRLQGTTPADFPTLMAQQRDDIIECINSISDEAMTTQEAQLPGGGPVPLGEAILNGPAKWLTAYRMQLFLYAKAAGATDIGTSNVWGGMDMPPKA